MKVTITIQDDDGGHVDWSAQEGTEGPYIKGPSLVIPREDGPDAHLDISALEAILDERKGT